MPKYDRKKQSDLRLKMGADEDKRRQAAKVTAQKAKTAHANEQRKKALARKSTDPMHPDGKARLLAAIMDPQFDAPPVKRAPGVFAGA